MGNAHEFTVPARSSTVFAEPTFAISTANSAKAGCHFEFIFIDDLVNETNYRSPKMLDKVFDDYLNICPLLEPSGYILLTGTRYTFDDAYDRIQENAKTQGDSTVWKFSIRNCWSSNCENCGCPEIYHDRDVNILQSPCAKCGSACVGFQSDRTVGTLFPPATTRAGRAIGHRLEFLNSQKAELGAANFANQYENTPLSSDLQTFTETMIGGQTIFDADKWPNDRSYTFAVGDLADSEGDENDMSVIYVVRKLHGQLFVVKCYFGHFGPNQIVDMVVKVLRECRPNILKRLLEAVR